MAKEKNSKLCNFLKYPTMEYKHDYKVWQNKAEWSLVGSVRNRIREMYDARQSTCFLTNFDNSSSWDKHWDLVEKNYLMYARFDGTDDFRSNLKSSMAYRTINSIDASERKQQIDFLVEARNESDESKGTAVVHKYIFKDYFRRNPDVRYKFFDCSKRSKIFGTSVAYIPYTVQVREVQEPQRVDITKEDIEKGILPEQKFDTKMKVDYEDPDFIPWNIRDFYIDPNAQCLHGTSYVATDCAGILYVTPEQVNDMFGSDPMVKNLDKIKTTSTETYSSPFFKVPKDIERGFCELIYYYNRITDSEVIICGDILIKEGPIPYKDKELPFVAFRFVKHPGQFYGIGAVDALLQQSAEDSAIKNARIERVKFATNPPVFVGATIFGDVDAQWDRIEPNDIIKVGDVTQVRPLELPSVPFDSWRVSEELKDEAVMNTGINPQGLTLPMASTPATNTITMKETMTDMVNMYEDNLMEGMNHWGFLLESRFCQFLATPTRKASLELGKKRMRELRLEDIVLYEKDGTYKTRDIKGSKIIPLDKKMFEWEETPRVYISADFTAPISAAFNARQAKEVLPQLAPFSGERGGTMQNGAPAIIDIRKLMRWYLDQMDMEGNDLLIDEDEDRLEEIEQAAKQHEAMQKGEEIVGIPGEPKAHRYTHAVELMRVNDTTQSDEFIAMMQSPDPSVQAFVTAFIDYKNKLTEHLRVDSLIAEQAAEFAMTQSDAFNQVASGQGGQQGAQMPRNNAVNVPTVSGNMGMPNQGGIPVPNRMDQTDITGQAGRI